jgi:CDP-diacylglycerol--glycerol-3-phosphate 3-phosphatidyltransferase
VTATTRLALALAALVLLTMPAFAVAARRRPRDAEVARRPATVLLGYWVRDWVMWLIAPLERALVRSGVSPDVFNYLGAGMGLLAGAAYARGAAAAAGWCVLLGGLADILDGRIARARGLASARGEFLDSMLDRFAETFALAGLALYLARRPLAAAAAALALGASMLVSYARAKGDAVGVACRGGVMQRAERLVLLAVASLADAPAAAAAGWAPGTLLAGAAAVVAAGALGTAVYRTAYVARALRARGG